MASDPPMVKESIISSLLYLNLRIKLENLYMCYADCLGKWYTSTHEQCEN